MGSAQASRTAVPLAALLAACGGGSPEARGTLVGPAGGVVEDAGRTARLEVPPGALATGARISLEPARTPPLDPHAVSRTALAVVPDGIAFAIPATLSVTYEPTGRPSGTGEGELALHALSAGAWSPLPQSTVDLAGHRVSAPIGASGTFGVVWPGPAGPCTLPEDGQFAFWLGHWSFSAPGAFPGTDDVAADGTGCLLEETFVDTSGTRGRSVSLYSRIDAQWHQTYVDSRGGRLVLVGALEGGRMVLYQSPSVRFFWEAVAPGQVRYAAERRGTTGTWSVFFDSTYTAR